MMPSFVKSFGRFWYDFIVGDDWKLAVAVVGTLALTLAGVYLGLLGPTSATIFGAVLLAVAFVVSMTIDVRRARREG